MAPGERIRSGGSPRRRGRAVLNAESTALYLRYCAKNGSTLKSRT